jgi:hypothetical protein
LDSPSTLVTWARQLGQFIVWLSGALVGVTGLLYVVGYIARSAHSRFLGLDSSRIEFEPLTYLATGANASIYVALDFGVTLFSLSLIIFLVPIWSAIQRFVGNMLRRISVRRLPAFADRCLRRHGYGLRVVCYSLLFVYVFFLFYDRYVDGMSAVLGISDVLQDPRPTSDVAAESLRNRVLCASEAVLKGYFTQLLVASMIALLVTALAWRIAAGLASHYLLIAPFAVLSVTLIYLLSSAFGILLLSRSFSPIEVTTQNQTNPATLYLVDRTSAQMILWDPTRLTILLVPEGAVMQAKLGKPKSLVELHPGLAGECRQAG